MRFGRGTSIFHRNTAPTPGACSHNQGARSSVSKTKKEIQAAQCQRGHALGQSDLSWAVSQGEKRATDGTCGPACTLALPAQPSHTLDGSLWCHRGIGISGRGKKEEWEEPKPSVLVAPPYLAELKTTVLECSTRPP